jgi:hypothetical protein
MRLTEYGDIGVTDTNVGFTHLSYDPREEEQKTNDMILGWNNINHLGEYVILPYGYNDNIPDLIKQVVKSNYMAPGLLNRKAELLWRQGPKLYTESIEGNQTMRTLVEDKEILSWLESWDYEKYLQECNEDYQHIQGTFTKFVANKGSLIGKPFINRLEHIQPNVCRLAIKKDIETENPTHGVVYGKQTIYNWTYKDPEVYPLADIFNPIAKGSSIFYSNKYTFCTDYYTIPEVYGSLEWLRRSTAVPLIFKAMSENMLNLKFHIESPQKFWDKQREFIKANCEQTGRPYKESMLRDFQKSFLETLTKTLSGNLNAGKFIHTTIEYEVNITTLIEHGWKITVIDQKVKDMVEAQIAISQRADRAVAAGISLHSALGNMSETGKVDSGSEQIYALISYLQTGIDIPEMILMKPVNIAIRHNFKRDQTIKLGLFHNMPEKQKDTNPEDRSINNTIQK